MAVRRQQVITLNVPVDILADHVDDVLRGNPFYKDVDAREDRREFTFSSFSWRTVYLRWSVRLTSDDTKTLVTIENASLPFVVADSFNIQNRCISEFLTSLQTAADQTLLRASAAPPAKSDTLLRPADFGTDTAKEELLRPEQSEC